MKKKLLALAATTAVSLFANLASANKLNVVSFDGSYGASLQMHVIDPYMVKTGQHVLFKNYSGGIVELKEQVESGNVVWDAIELEGNDLERACAEGLLERFPMDQLPAGDDGTRATEDFSEDALTSECGVGNIYWSVLYAYNHNTIKGGDPSSMEDFFDTESFPGKRALRKSPQVNLEWALLADGVRKSEVYDELATEQGQARAFAKLDTIKDEIVWFDYWSQTPELLNDGAAVMVQSANGRFFSAIQNEGKPFEMVWDGHIFDLDAWAVVKGTSKKEAALDFVKFTTSSKPLAGMSETMAYGPTRQSSYAYIDESIIPQLPSAHLDAGLKTSGAFWAEHGAALDEKFHAWLSQ
ncbi:ABC transporter substrate-binding protein [Marinobacterium mangrovicola]|uniref:Putative spermidine/putrescine transport system substrate-binding protein n=1 Tax=Marinobacterium mangrovicola TaxID=1476959 RepID=A0A4R1GCJ6_9GAMM|nr:ABC transporter substrate-binding protein [Marinobacterium mangrovicola]TCK05754.1 putative spermidine/putrescine transport system substrate-binding protein [Marinobacterium mangrovicola]